MEEDLLQDISKQDKFMQEAAGPEKKMPARPPSAFVRSLRYPRLLRQGWKSLPHSIKRRFVKTSTARQVTIYKGRIHKTHISIPGWCLVKLSKLIGCPLPSNNCKGQAIVLVQECPVENAQSWTRIFPSHTPFPQVIQSRKQFQGPTGLEEIISPHVGVALKVSLADKSILFVSDHYFLKIRGIRLPLPALFTPGTLTVTHKETSPKRFRYTFHLVHPLFGEMVYQTGIFEEIQQ